MQSRHVRRPKLQRFILRLLLPLLSPEAVKSDLDRLDSGASNVPLRLFPARCLTSTEMKQQQQVNKAESHLRSVLVWIVTILPGAMARASCTQNMPEYAAVQYKCSTSRSSFFPPPLGSNSHISLRPFLRLSASVRLLQPRGSVETFRLRPTGTPFVPA